jgi:uncharacterized membrane protein YiaA
VNIFLAAKFFERNLVTVNLFLVLSCIIVNITTMLVLVYFSSSRNGAVLNYNPFGQNVLYDVGLTEKTPFLDFASYFITAIIIFNAVAFLTLRHVNTDKNPKSGITQNRKLAIRNLVVSILCLIVYVWTMTFVAQSLRGDQPIGGVVTYTPLFAIDITHVNQTGQLESSVNWRIYDITSWLLLVLFVLTIITIRRLMNKATEKSAL